MFGGRCWPGPPDRTCSWRRLLKSYVDFTSPPYFIVTGSSFFEPVEKLVLDLARTVKENRSYAKNHENIVAAGHVHPVPNGTGALPPEKATHASPTRSELRSKSGRQLQENQQKRGNP